MRVQVGGLRDEALLGVRKNLRYRWHTLAPALTLNGGLERIPVYTDGGTELASIDTRDLTGFLGVERSLGHGWIVAFGAVGRLWYQPDVPDGSAGRCHGAGRSASWPSTPVRVLLEAS